MRTLTFKEPSSYHINTSKKFDPKSKITERDLLLAFVFAYQMCFGSGYHRSSRTGGQASRNNAEKFCNTFQGKLAEIILHDFFIMHDLKCSDIDFRVMGENKWDDSDFIINNIHINVKSVAFFSNLLLLEKDDWDSKGNYVPNLMTESTSKFDFFVLIRLKPDIKKILKQNKLFYTDFIEKEQLFGLVENEIWQYDIPGFITHQELVENVISKNHTLPQNSMLNGRTKMDASNYYVQTGDLRPIEGIIDLLNP